MANISQLLVAGPPCPPALAAAPYRLASAVKIVGPPVASCMRSQSRRRSPTSVLKCFSKMQSQGGLDGGNSDADQKLGVGEKGMFLLPARLGSSSEEPGPVPSATPSFPALPAPATPLCFPWQPPVTGMLPLPSVEGGMACGSFTDFFKDTPELEPRDDAQPMFPAFPMLSPPELDSVPLRPLSEGEAHGIILRAAMGTGWTTATGLEGPSLEPNFPSPRDWRGGRGGGAGGLVPLEADEDYAHGSANAEQSKGTRSWPELTSSPRRTARVKFTCNRCGARTIRAINPHAYEEGTVFVQCGGCLVFHKLVDNLNLFHELKGPIFQGADAGQRGFGVHESVDVLGVEEPFFPTFPIN